MNRLCLWLAIGALGCADLTAPTLERDRAGSPAPAEAPSPNAALTRIRASHILIAYQGAQRATATRTKDEAKRLAEGLLPRVRGGGADFAQVAREQSDDPSAKATGGDLGAFDRFTMAPAFTQAAFALQPGQISNVVETDFGYHIIKRTE